MSEWTPEREILADIFDRLGTLVSLTAAGNPKLAPYPRPQTATHRFAEMESRRKHDDLHTRLYPNRE